MKQETCVHDFLNRVKNDANEVAYCFKKNSDWTQVTWHKFGKDVKTLAKGLLVLSPEAGTRVAILGQSRPEWVMSCIATQMMGGVSAGVYPSCSKEEVHHVLEHSEATILIVEDAKRWQEQVKPIVDRLPNLSVIVVMTWNDSIEEEYAGKRIMSFSEVLALGAQENFAQVEQRINALRPEDLATLIYTSGTTGPAKAVMLSHRATHWTVHTAVRLLHVGKGDSIVSYLPLAHIAEQMFSVYAPLAAGITLHFAESMDQLPNNLKEVQPTLFFGVPRVYEKFYAKVKDRVESARGVKKVLLNFARNVAERTWALKHQSKPIPPLLQLQYEVARRLVFNKLKPLLGLGRVRICVSGAAPIAREILQFFLSLDIPIYEVYGQSEDSGPTTFNIPGATKLGTVGRPIPGLEVEIAQDGEILVRGPNLFSGYYKDEEATRECFRDGWLHTGDIGNLDKNGFLCITDRKKDILITAGGKNISPQNLEGMLKQIPWVSSAVVVGDQKKYLAALLTPNQERLSEFAALTSIEDQDLRQLVLDHRVLTAIQGEIDQINRKLAPVEQIKKFALLPREFSIEEGELTPTMKIRRKVINARYQEDINRLYA